MTDPRVLAISEAELQRLVAALCARLQVHHYHTADSRRSEPGFPDSVIVGGAILFRELKSRNGVLSPEQRRWGSRITAAGGDWAVWRPRDWTDGTIHRQVLRIARPGDDPALDATLGLVAGGSAQLIQHQIGSPDSA